MVCCGNGLLNGWVEIDWIFEDRIFFVGCVVIVDDIVYVYVV